MKRTAFGAGLFLLLAAGGCLPDRSSDAPSPTVPSFEGPLEFLRSLDPKLPLFGPAGFPGIDPAQADCVPEDAAELLACMERLAGLPDEERAGMTIGLRAGRVYELSGLREVEQVGGHQAFFTVPSGVTLASLAGEEPAVLRHRFSENMEALLRANAYSTRALLALSTGSRLVGVRVDGPDVPPLDADYGTLPRSRFHGVRAGDGAHIEQCEIRGFHWSGVTALGRGVVVRGCDLFDIHAYPVLTGSASTAEFIGNRIRWSWHAVAGGGMPGSGYVFRHNLVIHEGPGGGAHAVDMHAWRQMMAAGGGVEPFVSIAGDTMDVVGNVFVNDEEAMARWRRRPAQMRAARQRFFERRVYPDLRDAIEVRIRGVPRDLAVIRGNWFANEDVARAVEMTSDVGEPGRSSRANLWIYDNYYGPGGTPHGLARTSYARIHFVHPPLEVSRNPETRRWDAHRIAVLRPGDVLRPVVEIDAPPGTAVRRVVFRLHDREQVFDAVPPAGDVVFEIEDLAPGVYAFTVEVEDDRGVVSRHDMPLTVEAEPAENTGSDDR